MKSLRKKLFYTMFIFFLVAYPRKVANMDAAHPWQVGFQDPASPVMEGIIFFNGLLMTFMLLIACFVGWLLYQSLKLFNEATHAEPVSFNHSTLLEIVWTIIPAVILMIISVPSYNLLYAMEEVIDPSLTIKVVGHQWYWSYECSDFEDPTRLTIAEREKSAEILRIYYDLFRHSVDVTESRSIEADRSETQTQLALVKPILEEVKKSLYNFPKGIAEMLVYRLELLRVELMVNEGRKEFYGPISSYDNGELVDIMADAEKRMKRTPLIPEQKELVIKALNRFKQYLRIIPQKDLDAAFIGVVDSVGELTPGEVDKVPPIADVKERETEWRSSLGKKLDILNKMLRGCTQGNQEDCKESYETIKKYLCLVDKEDDKNPDSDKGSDKDDKNPDSDKGSDKDDKDPDPGTGSSGIVDDGSDLDNGVNEIDSLKAERADRRDKGTAPFCPELSRAQREAYTCEAEDDRARVELGFAKEAGDTAKEEFEDAKVYSRWAEIDLLGAKVNQLTAAYIQADVTETISHRYFIRGNLLLAEGYPAWNQTLRGKIKAVSDVDKIELLKAHLLSVSGEAILRRGLLEMSPDEGSKAVALAGYAQAEITAMETHKFNVKTELVFIKAILDAAASDLEIFMKIAMRAATRLERATTVFDELKVVEDKAQVEAIGADVIFERAKKALAIERKLENLESDLDELGTVKPPLTLSGLRFDSAQSKLNAAIEKHNFARAAFFEGKKFLERSTEELIRSAARVLEVEGYVEKTTNVFNNIPIVSEEATEPHEPVAYFDNLEWDIKKRDVIVVESQLASGEDELELADMAYNRATKHWVQVVEALIEAEYERSQAILSLMRAIYQDNELFYNTAKVLYETSIITEEELGRAEVNFRVAKADLHQAEVAAYSLESNIVDAFYYKAKAEAESALESGLEPETHNTLNNTQFILDRAKESLSEVKVKKNAADLKILSSDGFDGFNDEWGITYPYDSIDRVNLYDIYADICFDKIKLELSRAETYYNLALETFEQAGTLLGKIYEDISNAPADFDKEELVNQWLSQEAASLVFDKKLSEFKKFNSALSVLDIKVTPGLLASKAYIELLCSEAELENADWISNELTAALDNPKFKPVSSSDKSTSGSSADYDPCRRVPEEPRKSREEVLDIFSNQQNREFDDYTQSGLFVETLTILRDLLETLNWRDAYDIRQIICHSFYLMLGEEKLKLASLEEHMALIRYMFKEFDDAGDDDGKLINFDSYLITDEDLVIPRPYSTGPGGKVFRLLEVDNRLFVPTNTHIRVLVTSADVLHSWAVPSLGVKVDACPGRLNQVFLFVKREGVFYGQCSELCGVNHGFMPIVVQAVNRDAYLTWVGKKLCS